MFFILFYFIFRDVTNCFLLTSLIPHFQINYLEKKIFRICSFFLKKIFILNLEEIFNESKDLFCKRTKILSEKLNFPGEEKFPLKYILIKKMDYISLEKQLFLRSFFEEKGENLRLIFLVKKIQKINPVFKSRFLIIKYNEHSKKTLFPNSNKITRFFLIRKSFFLNFNKPERNIKFSDDSFFFIPNFFFRVFPRWKPGDFLPNEFIFYSTEILKENNLRIKIKIGFKSFSGPLTKIFFSKCLEPLFLGKKDFSF